jgi:hypothetical protein
VVRQRTRDEKKQNGRCPGVELRRQPHQAHQEVEMTTESSVVVALREVRRLELERQRREEEARKREHEDERAKAEAAQRASIQYGPGLAPFANGQGWGGNDSNLDAYSAIPMRRTAEVAPLAAQAYAETQSVAAPPPGWLEQGMPFRPAPRPRSRFAAVVVTLMVSGGAGAAGYWKIDGDWQTARNRLQAENGRLENQRNEAVAARSKAEQELKLQMGEMQAKLAEATTRINAAEAAASASNSRPAGRDGSAGPLPGNRFNRPGARRLRGGGPRAMRSNSGAQERHGLRQKANNHSARANNPSAKANNPSVKANNSSAKANNSSAKLVPAGAGLAEPKVAKKKVVTDDPLGGIKL